MKTRLTLLVAATLLLLTSCSGSRVNTEKAGQVLEVYEGFLNESEAFLSKLALDPNASRAMVENNVGLLPENDFGGAYSLYSIQGYSLSDPAISIRDEVAYKRLMGHMNFQTVIDESGISVYSKVFRESPGLDHLEIMGIIKTEIPFESLKRRLEDLELSEEDGWFLVDANERVLHLPEMQTEVATDERLAELIKKLSLLEKEEGVVSLASDDLSGDYHYSIGERAIVGFKR